MFTLWRGLFSLIIMFPGLRIEAPNRVSVYTLSLKRRTMKFNICSYILNLVKIIISFFSCKYWQSWGRFIGKPCHNSQIERADLLAMRANQTQFLDDLLAKFSQRVKISTSFQSKQNNTIQNETLRTRILPLSISVSEMNKVCTRDNKIFIQICDFI